MKTRTLVLFATAALIVPGIVPGIALADFGQRHGPPWAGFEHKMHGMHERLADYDRDGDGTTTAEEVKSARAERFAAADANNDGVLDVDEMAAMIEQRKRERIEEHLARYDGDGDGKVTAEEYAAYHAGRFARLDRDDGGAGATKEFKARGHHGGREQHGGRGHDGGQGYHGGQGYYGGQGHHGGQGYHGGQGHHGGRGYHGGHGQHGGHGPY